MKNISSFRGPMYYELHKVLNLHLKDNYQILEPGCGSGLISLEVYLTFQNIKIFLLDINQKILENAVNNFNEKGGKVESALIGSVDDLSMFQDNYFDLVFNEGVLEHDPIDVKKAVDEMLRVSKNTVIFSIPDGDNLIYKIKKYVKRRLKLWEWDKYGYERNIGENYFKKYNYKKIKVKNGWAIYIIKK